MGSLAKWGAVAGAAKGWNEGSIRQEEQKQKSLDQEREERLATLANDRLVARENTNRAHETNMEGIKTENAGLLQESKNEFTKSEREATSQVAVSEGALDRQSREKVAQIGQDGQTARTKADKNSWQYKMQPAVTKQNPDGTISTEPGGLLITDRVSNISYVQKDGMFREAESSTPARPAKDRAGAEKMLLDNPSFERGRQFAKKFGYLPLEWFHVLEQEGMIGDSGQKNQ